MNLQELKLHLQKKVNWQRFINLVATIDNQFNDMQWRFLKATIFENSVESYSDGSVKYVGQEGCDLIVKDNVRVEMKYLASGFFTPKKNKPKKSCGIILMNVHGKQKYKELPKSYADYLLIVSKDAAGIVDKKTLNDHLIINNSSLCVDLPVDLIEFIFFPYEMKKPKDYNINLREEINNCIKNFIERVK